jgi:hypothetical protein
MALQTAGQVGIKELSNYLGVYRINSQSGANFSPQDKIGM